MVKADVVLIWAGAVAIGTGLSGFTRVAGGATGMVVTVTLPALESSVDGGGESSATISHNSYHTMHLRNSPFSSESEGRGFVCVLPGASLVTDLKSWSKGLASSSS